MDGFVTLVKDILIQAGVPAPCVFCKQKVEVPGFFRPEKKWDLLVVVDDQLLATIEFKSQIGPSFGNNFNNRTEESLGSAMDLLTAYRDGAFAPSSRPWLGYLMLLEEAKASTAPVSNSEPHFPVLPEFRDASYARRYEPLLLKLVRERLYDATCFLLASQKGGKKGLYSEPNSELGFSSFAASLTAKAVAYMSARK